MKVHINTKIPFFLWMMTERDAEIVGNEITTKKIVVEEDGKTQREETYTNSIKKTPWWLIALIKYLPIVLILLTADWGYRLWNGVGLFFAAIYVFWFFWMSENNPKQFYPVSITALILMLLVGFWTGTLLYANHILSNVVYLFLIKLLYDDLIFKLYDRYYSVEGKIGMFVFTPDKINYSPINKGHVQKFLLGAAGISLIVIVVNGALMFNDYRETQARNAAWLEQQQKEEALTRSGKAQVVKETKTDENLSKEQMRLRQELGIEVQQ